jgi:hypothetical protein
MAKSHYSVKKRNKELERKQRKEQKRQRKLNKVKIKSERNSNQFPEEIENIET